jgi:hypothetical protein
VELSLREQALATAIGFPVEVLLLVKQETQAPLNRLRLVHHPVGDLHTLSPSHEATVEGLGIIRPSTEAERCVPRLRPLLAAHGFTAFLFRSDDRAIMLGEAARPLFLSSRSVVGVIPNVDPYEILRILGTGSEQDGVSTAEIIAKLQAWEYFCTFDILGAGWHHIHLAFTTLPEDLQAFVMDVLDFWGFCVELTLYSPSFRDKHQEETWAEYEQEYSANELRALAQKLSLTHRLVLWWD